MDEQRFRDLLFRHDLDVDSSKNIYEVVYEMMVALLQMTPTDDIQRVQDIVYRSIMTPSPSTLGRFGTNLFSPLSIILEEDGTRTQKD